MEFSSIAELRVLDGLRLVLVAGSPSPWGQCAKAMMEFKGLDFATGLQVPAGANEELVAWSGVNSGPVVAWNDEKPIDRWLDILNLLERLAPEPALLPADRAARAEVVGLANEICGELGLGWNRRLSLFRPAHDAGDPPERILQVGAKHGYNAADAGRAAERQVAGLGLLAGRLEAQRARGDRYFIADGLTALDFYWAGFSVLFAPPPDAVVPLEPERRAFLERIEPEVAAALTPRLVAHRDVILERHFKQPMVF